MREGTPRQGARAGRVRVASLEQLDALVGEWVAQDMPEVAWEDSFGVFRFPSREEAEEAIQNSYYRLFRPELDWDAAEIEEVRTFPRYTRDLVAAWTVVERLGAEARQTEIRRQGDFWRAMLAGAEAFASTPAMAICLAGLRARGIDPIFCDSLLDDDIPSPMDEEAAELI